MYSKHSRLISKTYKEFKQFKRKTPNNMLKNEQKIQAQWFMPIIPASWEDELEESKDQAQSAPAT